jgi:SPW repeat
MKAVYWFIVYLLIGIWSVIAPYALSFPENSGAFWSSLLVGAMLVLISAAGLYIESGEEADAHFPHSRQKKTA